MQRLRIVLQSKYFYILLSVICFIYSFFFIYQHNHKIVDIDLNKKIFEGYIEDYSIKDEKAKMTFISDKKYIVNYKNNIIDNNYFCYGCSYRIIGKLEKANTNTIPYAFNYRKYLENNNIYYVIKADKVIKIKECSNLICKIRNNIYSRINKIDDSGYLKSFILGDKKDLQEYNIYQELGVAHLFAISGMHIGIFIVLLLFLFKKFNVIIKYFLVFIFLFIYGTVLGFSASILRCIIFFVIGSINKIFKLGISSLQVLLLTIFMILFYNPLMIFNIGFQYSCMTVWGIIYCSRYLYGNYLVKALKTSAIAFLFSFPISLLNYYSINLLSVIYNIFYIPFVTFIIYPFCIISFLMPLFLKTLIIFIKLMIIISVFLNKINFMKINMSLNVWEVIIIYSILLIAFRYNNMKLLILIVCVLIIDYIIPYFDQNNYIYFFDVGQGDSSLIISSKRKDVILIDTGGDNNSYMVSDNVINMLNYLGINKIDLIILSHGDNDHCGEIMNYIKNKKVEHIKINRGELSQCEIDALKYIDNSEYKFNSLRVNYLNYKDYDNENDNSVLSLIRIGDYNLLTMGDASSVVEDELIKKYDLPKIDILKVSHHGSKTSSSKYFINNIKPKYSIISVGKYNRYGHPNKEVLKNLYCSNLYRTDKNGSVVFIIKKNKIRIKTFA